MIFYASYIFGAKTAEPEFDRSSKYKTKLIVPMFDWLRDGSRSVHLRGRGAGPGMTLNSTLAQFTSYLGLLVHEGGRI